MNKFNVSNKVALVTGASRGLGQAIAIGLAEQGAQVICTSSSDGGTNATVEEIKAKGSIGYGISVDLSGQDAAQELYEQTINLVDKVDILVNNAGTIARHPAVDFPAQDWNKVIQVNLTAAFQLCQLIGKFMIDHGGGKIINIASMLSYSGGITVPAYTASKHGVAGITKALANEWAIHNIQVNAIAPGYMKTDNTQALQDNPERNKSIVDRIPAGRWGEPEDLVGAVLFLASTASDYVNGTMLNVDGGWMAR